MSQRISRILSYMALALITVLPMNEVAMARISAGSTQMQVGRYSQPATTSRISAGNVITNRAISRVGGGCSILPGGYCYNSSTNRLSAGTTFYGGSAPSDSAIRGGSTTTVRTTSRIPASGVSSMPLSERITAGTLNPVGAGMIIAPINRITASGSSTGSSGGHINASGTSTGTSGGRITASGSGTGTSGGRIVAGGSTTGSTSGGRIVAGGSTTGSTSGGRIVAGGSTTGTTSDGRIVASGNGTTPGGGCSTLPGGYCYNPTQPDNRIVASGSGGTTVSQGDSNRINASGTNNPHISLCNDRPYPDDVDAHWSEIYVRRLYDLCVVEGYSDGTFRPEQEVTRAELTKMALFAKGVSPYDCDDLYCDTPFADLDAWQGPWIRPAYLAGIVEGYQDGSFRPNQSITRSEAVKVVLATFDYRPLEVEKSFFNDVDDWSVNWVERAHEIGLVQGVGNGNFDPSRAITRAEAAKIIALMVEHWDTVL